MKQKTIFEVAIIGCIFLNGCSSVDCSSVEILPGYCLTSADNSKSTSQDSALPKQDWEQEYNGQTAYTNGHNQDEETNENEAQQLNDNMSTEYQSQINDDK